MASKNCCDCTVIHHDVVHKIEKDMLSDAMYERLALLFHIFGDGTRIRILHALEKGELCVCDLSALLGMTKSIATEYYKENIRVHAISPGGVFTDMVKVTRPDLTGEGMIMPEDIAEIAYFFLAHRGNAVIDEILVHRVGKEPFQV